jgi:histidinol-phosphatase (PHP family)
LVYPLAPQGGNCKYLQIIKSPLGDLGVRAKKRAYETPPYEPLKQKMIYKTDYHIHTLYSDGKAAPEEYILAAIEAGLNEIGFSEHLNLIVKNQKWCLDIEKVPEYIAHIKSLRVKEKTIGVRTGLEVDYFPGKEKEIYDFIAPLQLDYVMGSVHYVGDITVDSGPDFYENRDIDALYGLYFGLVVEAVESGLFDIIAHCDYVRIYNYMPKGSPEKHYRNLAKTMSKHDVAFEINTNGRNRPLGDFYPDRRFLHIFREENVPVCVNSDAHLPSRVGQHFDEAYGLLKEAGYKEMAVFRKRERFMVPVVF